MTSHVFDTVAGRRLVPDPSPIPAGRKMPDLSILHYSGAGRDVPAALRLFAQRTGYRVISCRDHADLFTRVRRAYPAAIVLDGTSPSEESVSLCKTLKGDAFTEIVPVVIHMVEGSSDDAAVALLAGADEVIGGDIGDLESMLRMELALRRADRDVSVHPTTRLPGTARIEREFADRIRSGEQFAVCYADLDHFKEFNDRYGYNHGDRVILIVSRILRDVVRGHSPDGFVGHIGGDDFIFVTALEDMKRCCEDVIEIFDTLTPLQYLPEDRERGSFIGTDRRGNSYEVPLMTLSIGVVTNSIRELTHPGEISELVTEMKAYAKSFTGSIYLVDRRSGKMENSVKAVR